MKIYSVEAKNKEWKKRKGERKGRGGIRKKV